MKNPRRWTPFLAALMAISVFAIAANYAQARPEGSAGSAYPELLSQMPAGASTLIFIDLASLRNSAFFHNGVFPAPLPKPDPDYTAFVQATGFDYEKDLDRTAIALLPPASSSEKYQTMILAEGRFNEQKIRDYAIHHGKIEHLQQREIFVFPAKNSQGYLSVAFLNDHRLAMVEGTDVAPLLSAAPAAPDDPMRQRAEQIDGAPLFAVSRMPAIPDDVTAGSLPSAQLRTLIRSIQWITLAARPEGQTLRVSVEGECRSDTDARQMAALLQVLRAFGQAALNAPQAHQQMDPTAHKVLQSFLQTADISQSAASVRVRLELTPDALKMDGSKKPSQDPSEKP